MKNNQNKIWNKELFLSSKRPFFWIISVVFFVYLSTLFHDIVYLDDNVLVVEHYYFNEHLTNSFQAFGEDIFRSPQGGGTFYRPILRLSFISDAIFGEKAIIFMSHLTNMALHILSICAFFYLLLKIGLKKEAALLFSLIFAIHPLTAQTVAFIPGRNDSLLAVFIFLSLIYFLNFLENNTGKQYFLHLLFFTLALFTKETAIVLPAICAAYIVVFIGFQEIKNNLKKYSHLIIGWMVLVSTWFVIRHEVMGAFVGNADYNIFQSIFNNLPAILPAIGKIFLPFDLSVFPVMKDMSMLYGIISLLLLLIWFILSKEKNYKMIIFGFLWFLIFILLTLLKPTDTMPEFSENRIYIPMLGFVFIIWGLRIPKFFNNFEEKNVKRNMIILAVGLIIIFSCVTIYRNKYYKNKINFWENAVKTSPSFAFNHNNLGAMNYLDKKLDIAEVEFKKALDLNPKEKMAHNNLGLIYMDRGELEKSEEEFKKELEINPAYDNGYFNMGLLYYKLGRKSEAEDAWKNVLKINPNFNSALNNLAAYYYEEKNFQEAIKYAQEISRRGLPLHPELQKLLQSTNSLQPFNINLKK